MAAKRVLKFVLLAAAFFALSATAALAYVGYTYHNRFYPGISVGGQSLDGRTRAAGYAAVSAAAESYMAHEVTVVAPDLRQPKTAAGTYPDLTLVAEARDYGLHVAAPTDAAWAVGHTHNLFTWLSVTVPALFRGTDVPMPYTLNPETLATYVHTEVSAAVVEPTSAALAVKDGVASVTPSVPGLKVDETALKEQLKKALSGVTDSKPIVLTIPSTLVDAAVTEKEVQPIADQLNALGATKVTFAADGISLRPTRAQLVSWYLALQDDSGKLNLAIQKDKVLAFLKTNSKVDTDKSLDGAVQTLGGLLAGTPPATLAIAVTAKPVVEPVVTPGAYNLGLFPGRYVEVNLAEQRLYAIEGNTLVKTYIVSTGKASTPTPVGTFYIGTKVPRAYSYSFGLYMPWWQAFLNDEYGLHELPEWPNGYKEGAAHLGIPVSHGCVRLGVGDAQEVYNWTSQGTPVVIH